jgi:hypothetical protein
MAGKPANFTAKGFTDMTTPPTTPKTLPEALRLANYLEKEWVTGDCLNAARELRRLYAENAALAAQPPAVAAIPEGWSLTPPEPTEEMINSVSSILGPYPAKLVWMRMHLIAPQPPAGQQDSSETAKVLGSMAEQLGKIAAIIKYPEDWDTAAYPTLESACDAMNHAAFCHAENQGFDFPPISGEATAAQGGKRCEYCDGTGDVHRADGEWLGACTCPLGAPSPAAPAQVLPLTEERIKDICSMIYASDYPGGVADLVLGCSAYDIAIVRAAERAHGIGTTAPGGDGEG